MKQIRFVTKNWTLVVHVIVVMMLMSAAVPFAQAQAGSEKAGQKPAPAPSAPAPAPAKPGAGAPAPAPSSPTTATTTAPAVPGSVQPKPVDVNTPQAPLPADYVIGPDDTLIIIFWREKDLSSEVTVRPDGKISIPLLQDVDAAGLTPEQLQKKLLTLSQRFVEDANITVVVKQINSRKVFITGQVTKPGTYLLTSPTSVVQLIAMAGGLLEYADSKNIVVVRTEKDTPVSYRFNYKEMEERKNLKQNIMLRPGDTVLVP